LDRGSREGALRLVLFRPLTQSEIEPSDLMFNALRTRLAERRITLDLTEDARRAAISK
jgi:ATP-dependent Clp protease ATP-binding subunit ClpB